jgi:response regulator RpfG family c-di-GMP phosphodiesterase
MASNVINVLYIDDEVFNLKAFAATFRRQLNVFTAESASEGLKVLEQTDIDVILCDHQMPGIKGLDFLKSIIEEYPKSIRILLTGQADSNLVQEALTKGSIYKCIYKPWDSDALLNDIVGALNTKDSNTQHERY